MRENGRNGREQVHICAPAVKLPLHFIPLHHSILNIHDAVGVLGDVVLVGDEDDGVAFGMQTVECVRDQTGQLRQIENSSQTCIYRKFPFVLSFHPSFDSKASAM